jgi:RNA polymerase sigma factor (sigma-70 family)
VRDAHLADDVTQTVFLLLARKAPSLAGQMRLGPWLFKVTRYTSLQALRAQRRRSHHEHKASVMSNEVQAEADAQTSQFQGLLNEMLARLNPREREALLLRFYEGKSFPAVGQALGISEEAARKRVERAVHNLRDRMHRRGVTIAPSAFVGLLARQSSITAPMTAAHVTASALGGGSASHIALADATLRAMIFGKMQLFAAAVGGVVVVSCIAWGVVSYIHPAPAPIHTVTSLAPARGSVVSNPNWSAQPAGREDNPLIARGWPIALPGSVTASPVVADLAGDGRLAVIVPCQRIPQERTVNGKSNESALLYAFYADGTPVPGWPAELVTPDVMRAKERTNGRYVQSWCSSPSVCTDASGKTQIVITTPYFCGLRVVDANGKARTFRGGSQWVNVPVTDMDGDRIPDIVTGAALTNIEGGSIKNWPPTHALATVSGFAPCIGDANHAGKTEVFHLFVDQDGKQWNRAEAVGFDATGRELPHWRHPIRRPRLMLFPPVMGDVSGDDKMEIIAGAGDLHVWCADGSSAPGTHSAGDLDGILKENVWTGWSSPTLADLDGDGKAEIIVYDHRAMAVRAFHGDGKPLGASADGMIAQIPASDLTQQSVNWRYRIPGAGVSVADLGGDGILDLFVGTYWIKWDPKARTSTIKPMIVDATVTNATQPTICDLDGDGKAEIVFGLTDGRVFVYRTEMDYHPELVQWATANGNFQHTGVWTKPAVK